MRVFFQVITRKDSIDYNVYHAPCMLNATFVDIENRLGVLQSLQEITFVVPTQNQYFSSGSQILLFPGCLIPFLILNVVLCIIELVVVMNMHDIFVVKC